jgi:carboxymethylenebutenolidase
VAPIDLTEKLSIPLIGLFGNDDGNPTADQVNRTEALLKKLGKAYEFYRYDGVGHAFFNYERPGFKAEPMLEGWKKVFAFLDKHLAAARAAAE